MNSKANTPISGKTDLGSTGLRFSTPISRDSLPRNVIQYLQNDAVNTNPRISERTVKSNKVETPSLLKPQPQPQPQPLKFGPLEFNPTNSMNGLFSVSIKTYIQLLLYIKETLSNEAFFLKDHVREFETLHSNTASISLSPEMRKYKYLINFDCFLLYNKNVHPDYCSFYKLINRFSELLGILEEMLCALFKESSDRNLLFFEESEFYKCLSKIFSQTLFQKEPFLKVCSELWKFIRQNIKLEPSNPAFSTTLERIRLFLFGISIPSNNPKDYPLHKAIYESNIAMVRKLCERSAYVFYTHIEEADPLGVTPLMLAVRLARKEIVLILADHGVNPKLRVFPSSKTPLEEAVEMKQKSIVRTLLIAHHHQILLRWKENKNRILTLFEKMPDFEFQIDCECDSKFIPFVKTFAPKESYYLYKRESFLRIDMNLVGWSKIRALKGNVSLLIHGKGPREGEILVIDNITKTISNLLKDINLTQLDKEVDDLISQEQYASEVRAENISLSVARTWRGEPVVQKIDNYDTTKYNAKGTFHLLLSRSTFTNQFDSSKLANFSEYFNYCLQNQIWTKEKDLTNQDEKQPKTLMQTIIDYMESNGETIKDLFGENYEKQMKIKPINPSDRENFLKLRVLEKNISKHYKKSITGNLWITENFPLSIDHLLPILDLLASANPKILRIREFFEKKNLIQKNCFPLKAVIPIFFSVNVIISFRNFTFKKPDYSLFDLKLLSTRTFVPRKDQIMYSGERIKTEGYTEDFESPMKYKKNWDDWFNQKDDKPKENPLMGSNFIQEEDDSEIQFAKSFFGRDKKSNAPNTDYINIFEEDGEADEFNQSAEMSEKFRNETLKVNSHQTHVPKSIGTILEKFSNNPTRSSKFIPTGLGYPYETQHGVSSIGKIVQTDSGQIFKSRNHMGPEIPLIGSTPKPKVFGGDGGKSFDKSYEDDFLLDMNSNQEQKFRKMQHYNTNKQNLAGKSSIQMQGSVGFMGIRPRDNSNR